MEAQLPTNPKRGSKKEGGKAKVGGKRGQTNPRRKKTDGINQ